MKSLINIINEQLNKFSNINFITYNNRWTEFSVRGLNENDYKEFLKNLPKSARGFKDNNAMYSNWTINSNDVMPIFRYFKELGFEVYLTNGGYI